MQCVLTPHALSADGIALVKAQEGVVSVAQLHRLGYSRHSVQRAAADWTRLGRGVYLTTRLLPEAPWASRVWAGILMGGEGACASGPTAALLHGLLTAEEVDRGGGYLPAAALRATSDIEVFVGRRRVMDRPGYVFVTDHTRGRLPPRTTDPPRIGIDDTVLDLCEVGPARDVATWVSRACQRRLTTGQRVLERLDARPFTRHAVLIRAVLSDVTLGATTELERRAMHDVFAAHGLPPGRRQARTRSRGRIVDVLLGSYALVVELDGTLGHVEEGRFRDRRRDNEHTAQGRWTLRYGWQEVTGAPCACAAEIGQALRDRGWSGEFRRCPGCP